MAGRGRKKKDGCLGGRGRKRDLEEKAKRHGRNIFGQIVEFLFSLQSPEISFVELLVTLTNWQFIT